MDIEVLNKNLSQYKELYTMAVSQSIDLTEEDIKNAIISPLIKEVWMFKTGIARLQMVGTFATEVEVQVGHDTTVYPDYMLYCTNNKAVVVEAKSPKESIDDNIGQLETAVNASSSTMGILCNGIEFAVFLKNNNGNMENVPCKRISLLNISDDDRNFVLNMFDVKYGVNDAHIRREMENHRKLAIEKEKQENTINYLIDEAFSPSDETIKSVIKKVENTTIVYAPKLQEYKEKYLPLYMTALKDRLTGDVLSVYKKQEAQKNHLEPYEFACGKIAEMVLKLNKCDAVFQDDEEAADKSVLRRSDTGKILMWFLGDVNDTGYTFKGIAFPSRAKGRGKTIRINDPLEIFTTYGSILQGVYDHIMSDTWAEFYRDTLDSLT